jgi:hypothetical protein
MVLNINDEYELDAAYQALKEEGVYPISLEVKTGKAYRTAQQRKSIELYCSMVAVACNDAGWTKKKYYEAKKVDVEWTQASVKEDMWRLIQQAMGMPKSTTELDKAKQVSAIYENMNKFLSDNLAVNVPFPSRYGY